MEQLILRPADSGDLAFILNSWLRSNRNSTFAKRVPNAMYFEEHHRVVTSLLARGEVVIAANREDPGQIIGWACFEEGAVPILHYVYVKQAFRGLGIARHMLSPVQKGAFVYTHEPDASKKLFAQGIYSPYLMFKRLGETA